MIKGSVNSNWKLYSGKIQERWGHLTGNPMDIFAGRRQQIAARLLAQYGQDESSSGLRQMQAASFTREGVWL